MSFSTKADVLAVLDGGTWSARYKQGDDEFSFDPVVCFLVLRHTSGRIEVKALVPDEDRGFEQANRWSNFDGLVR